MFLIRKMFQVLIFVVGYILGSVGIPMYPELIFVIGYILGILDVAGWGPIGWFFRYQSERIDGDAAISFHLCKIPTLFIVPPIYGYLLINFMM